ncbi:MAG: HAD-IIB family hydrolase [Candidatus Aminicenantes bacterium]|nr:HAD-IIB family hydrolase [Candidatus Aminicenantes bacterium]
MSPYRSQKNYQYLVFTDLDGTLLDHETYSFEPALSALNAFKERNIPIIICTSKTRAEIEIVRTELHNTYPFISENGGAIFIPKNYFSDVFPFTKEESDYFVIELGTPYSKLREVFEQIKNLNPGKIKGFGDFTPQEVAELCGFSVQKASLAKKREYDEPFILENDTDLKKIQEIAEEASLQITRGGRFYHLLGNNDKGKAILLLKNIYKEKSEHLKSIALGDSLNDFPMLEVVDYPILVQKPDESYDPSIKLKNLILASGKGPSGWSKAVFKLLNKSL